MGVLTRIGELIKAFSVPQQEIEGQDEISIDKLGRIPDDDEHPVIEDEKLTYKVEEIEDKRIKYVKVCRNMNEETEEEEEEK